MKRNRLKIRGLLLIVPLLLATHRGTGLPLADPEDTPRMAIKSNLVSDLTSSLNLGMELKLHSKLTLDLPLQYNPWTFSGEKKMRHFLFQPEARYWLCEAFNRHFVGLHLHGGIYNVGAIGFSDYMKEHRFEGWMLGGGISWGYQWILSPRWSLEATLGVGYAYLDYEVYPCEVCGKKLKESNRHFVGPTRIGISLIYIIAAP